MPILGILDSAKTGNLITNSYESIATTTVGSGGTGTITFSSIPSTFTHLQIRIMAQTNRATFGIDEARLRFNGDTGSNYAQHLLYGDGATATATASSSVTSIQVGSGNLGTTTGSNFGDVILDVLDYTNTNKTKVIRALGGADCNGTVGGIGGRVGLSSGLWNDTSSVTTITLTPINGALFSQHSSFALYGIKG